MPSTKKFSRKLLSLLLTAAVVLSLLPALPAPPALADDTEGTDVFNMLFKEDTAKANENESKLPYRDGSQLLSVRSYLYGQSNAANAANLFGKNGKMNVAPTDSSYVNGSVPGGGANPFKLPSSFSSVSQITYLNTLKVYEGDFNGNGRKDQIAVVCTVTYMRSNTKYSALMLFAGRADNFATELNAVGILAEETDSSASAFSKYSPSEIYHYADIICADLNGDGLDEIVAASYGRPYLSIYSLNSKWKGTENWSNPYSWDNPAAVSFGAPSYVEGLNPPTVNDLLIGYPGVAFSMSAGDIDRDGCEDIVYVASALVHGDYTGAFRSAYVAYGSKNLSDLNKSSQQQKLDIGADEGTGAAGGDDVSKPGFGCLGVTVADMDNNGQLQILVAYKEIHGIYWNKADTTYWATYYAVRRLDFAGKGSSFQYQTVYRAKMYNYVRISLTDRVTSAPLKIAKLDYDYGRSAGVSGLLSSGSIVVNGIIMSYVKHSADGSTKYSYQVENKDFYPTAYSSTPTFLRAGEIDNKVEVYGLRRGTLTGGGDGYLLYYNFYSIPLQYTNGNTHLKWFDCSAAGSQTAYREISAVSRIGSDWRYYALPQLDDRSVVLKFEEHDFFWSDPVILAALASPPYFSTLPKEKYKDGATVYGQYSSSSSGSSNSSSYSVGAYVSAEVTLGGPGVKAVVESEVEYNHTWTTETEKTKTVSYTSGFATSGGQDSVVLSTHAFDVYLYKLSYPTDSTNPSMGTTEDDYIVVVPRGGASASQIRTISYDDYENIRQYDKLGVFPDLSGVFSHTVGKPETYPAYETSIPSGNVVSGSTLVNQTGMGFPTGEAFNTQKIEVTEENTTKTTEGNSVTAKLGAGIEVGSELVGSAKITAGVTGGTDWTKGKTVSSSKGVYFEGNVYGQGESSSGGTFTYQLMRYVYTDNPQNDENVTTHEFPVVTYVATGVTQPSGVVPDGTVTVTATSPVNGTITETTSGTVTATFNVSAPGITREAVTKLVGAPFGMEYASPNIQQASQNIDITIDSNVRDGSYPLTLVVGGVESEFTLKVDPLPSLPTIITTELPYGATNTAYRQTLDARGSKPITWSITDGNLPTGLTLDPDTGVISGTPTQEGEFAFTVGASNSYSAGSPSTKALSITVKPKFSGSGTTADPYIISTARELALLAEWVNAGYSPYADAGVYYRLGADIDLSGEYGVNFNEGKGWRSIGDGGNSAINDTTRAFKGHFDGAGHTISGLYIKLASDQGGSYGQENRGLFGYIYGGSVSNLGLVDVNIEARSFVGGIASFVENGNIANCYVTGSIKISGSGAGGIAYNLNKSSVSNCYVTADITGMRVGGLVSNVGYKSSLTYSYATGTVTSTSSPSKQWAGGLAYSLANGEVIKNCAALNPKVDGEFNYSDCGRIAGEVVDDNSYHNYNNKLVGNVAYVGMLNGLGTTAWSSSGENESGGGKDGIDVTIEQINNGEAFPWFTADAAWTWEPGKLPGLFGETAEMPDHLKLPAVVIPEYQVDFSVTSGTGANGSLAAASGGSDIAGGTLVQEGESVMFTATPDDGYRVKEWKVGGVVVDGNTTNNLILTNLQQSTSVTVEFEPIPTGHEVIFVVTGGNGTLDATVGDAEINSGGYVENGKDVVFTAAPDTADSSKGIVNGYRVKEWKVGDDVVDGNTTNTYALTNLQVAARVTVEFEEIPVPVISITVTGEGSATTISTDGGELQMSAGILPVDATNQTVTWSVANGTGSAVISDTGLLVATGNGTVTVRATANDGSGEYGELEITISGQVASSSVKKLTSVAGQDTLTLAATGTQNSPVTGSLTVDNSVAELKCADIVHTGAVLNLYSDSEFTTEITGDDALELVSGSATHAYIKVTAQDLSEAYYDITINRASSSGATPATTNVTFTAVETGGTSGTADSSGIVLTFDQPVTGLTADDITIINGTGLVTKGTLTGSDKIWTIGITSVTAQGDVSVSVADFGSFHVITTSQTVAVYKDTTTATTNVTFTAVETGGTSGTADSSGIVLTFDQPVTGLTAGDITITDDTGSVTKGTLTGSDETWTIWLTSVAAEGDVTVSVVDFGSFHVATTAQTVAVYKATPVEQPLSGSLTVSGALKFGQMLTANVNGAQDGATLAYQWKRGDDSGANIGENSAHYTIAADDIGQTITVVVTATGYTGSLTATIAAEVSKADAPTVAALVRSFNKDFATSGNALDLAALLPADRGATAYNVTSTDNTLVANATVDSAGILTFDTGMAATAASEVITVDVTMNNYEGLTVSVTVNFTAKTVPAVTPIVMGDIGYGQPLSTLIISATAMDGIEWVPGTIVWDFSDSKPAVDATEQAWTFEPEDTDTYASVQGAIAITVNKALPSGAPTFTPITEAGKTLADAALTGSFANPYDDSAVAGTLAWNEVDSTTVTADTAYDWTFTPADTTNYSEATGSLTPYTPSAATYTVTFDANGGSVSPTSAQTGADGKLSSLPTPTRSGSYSFDGWFTTADGGTQVTTTTVFTVNTAIYAHWTYTGGSGGGSGGSGGGGGGTAATNNSVPAADGTVSVNFTQADGTVTLNLSSSKVTEIIDKAQSGKSTLDISKVSGATDAALPTTALTQLAEAGLAVEVKMPRGTMTLSADTAKSVAAQANGASVEMEFNQLKVSDLNVEQRKAVKGSDVIVDLNISSGDQKITNLGGELTVTVPYSGPTPAAAWYLNDNGELEQIASTYDPATKTVTFVLTHLSLYVVGSDLSESERLAGNSRIDTAVAISQKGWPEKADTVILAYAYSFPDALAAAPLAYKEKAPILLTDNQKITPAVLAEIQRLNPSKVILVGGTAVLSAEVENTLRQTYQVTRYAGTDCYATAAQIADAVGTTGRAVVVNGEVYQDALAISSYAANQGIPILFSQRDLLPSATTEALSRLGVNQTIVIGGTGVVSAAVYAGLPNPTRYAGYDCYETAAAVAGAAELNMNLAKVYVVTGADFADALVAGNLAAYTMSPLIMVGGGSDLPSATENFFRTNQEKIQGITIVGGTVVVPESQVNALMDILN